MASRLPTGSSNSTDPAFEGGNTLFEHGIGGIGNAGIHMAGPFGVEYGSGVIGALEYVGRGLVNRSGACAGCCVRLLAGVQG